MLSAPTSWAAAPKAKQTTQSGVYKAAIDRGVGMDEVDESIRLRANALIEVMRAGAKGKP